MEQLSKLKDEAEEHHKEEIENHEVNKPNHTH